MLSIKYSRRGPGTTTTCTDSRLTSSTMSSTTKKEPKLRTPQLLATTVTTLVRDLYGLHVQTCEELDSFKDRNYHVKVDASKVCNEHVKDVCADGYILKILNAQNSKDPGDVRTETALMQHIHGKTKGVSTPHLIPTIHGLPFAMCSLNLASDTESFEVVRDAEVKKHAIRLLEYIPGTSLISVPLTPHLCYQLGLCAATIDITLQDFDDSSFKIPGETFDWILDRLPSLRHLIDVIKDRALQCIISDVIDAFESTLLEINARGTLKTGYIHGDFNLNNVLVNKTCSSSVDVGSSSIKSTSPQSAFPSFSDQSSPPSSPSPSSSVLTSSSSSSSPLSSSPSSSSLDEWNVSGVVDFGDMTKTYVVFELAIAMCDVMLRCLADDNPDVMAGHVLAGYLSQMSLNSQEIEILPLTISARLAQCLMLSQQTLDSEPHNHYVLSFCAPVVRQLPRFWKIPFDTTLSLWREIAEGHGLKFPTSY